MARITTAYIGVLFVGLFLGGCAVDPQHPAANDGESFLPWVKTSAATHGYMYATVTVSQGNGEPVYESGGEIFSGVNHDIGVTGGLMTAGNLGITDDNGIGHYASSLKPTFGDTTMWGLEGNLIAGVPGFIDSMYSPAMIAMSNPTNGTALSKSASLSVQWNPDTLNESVVVGFQYLPELSQSIDAKFPSDKIVWNKVTEDDGSFTIPTSAFATLPIGSMVRLIIARGNTQLVGTASVKFHAYSYAYADLVMAVAP